jgi:uncharacterized delta-60 repeat protein
MPWHIGLIRMALVVCSIALAGPSALARAQSPIDGFDPGANGTVTALAVQPDGKILVGGIFTTLGGAPRDRLGRLNADGSIDTSFNPGANDAVNTLVVQPDGKILVGGWFTTLGGGAQNYIGRLNADGSPDTSFNFNAFVNFAVSALAVQPDGKILVGGVFTVLAGDFRSRIGRLHPDGSLDVTFNPGASGGVFDLAIQTDGKILVGGEFTTLGGAARNNMGRLHADGLLDTSFTSDANDVVRALAVQPDGKILVGGYFTTLGGLGRNQIGRLHAGGAVDAPFNPGASNDGFFSSVDAVAIQPDGKILVGGAFTTLGGAAHKSIGRVNAEGVPDATFNPEASNAVYAMAVQPDGKISVGGSFETLGGVGRNNIGRLHADGSTEVTFTLGTDLNGTVFALAVQPDGRVVVGGVFDTLGGSARQRLGRFYPDGRGDHSLYNVCCGSNSLVLALAVQPDGKLLVGGSFTSLEPGFTHNSIGRLNPNGSSDTTFNSSGTIGTITSLALQPDGKILVGGGFTTFGGVTRNRITRLNADGSLDTTFNPGANDTVSSLAVQPDGKIVVGGRFTGLGGGTGTTPRGRIGRLEADGLVDMSFNPDADNTVEAVALQADGKILVGGLFTTLGGETRHSIGRLNADGLLDTSFNPGASAAPGPTTMVITLAVQADGGILVGGNFTTLGGALRNRIGRLSAGGLIDATFNPGSSGVVNALALQADGAVLVGGAFSGLGGGTGTTARSNLGRLTNSAGAVQSLAVSRGGGVITWSRGGAAPELSRVTFESSTDGTVYTAIGSGTRIAGGWQLAGQTPPIKQNLFIRALGSYATGMRDGSASVVESVRNAYIGYLAFTDDDLTAGVSLIKAVHINELRARIAALRASHNLGAYSYTHVSILAGSSVAHAVDITELRTALSEVYTAEGRTPPSYGTSSAAGVTMVVADIAELRAAVVAIE